VYQWSLFQHQVSGVQLWRRDNAGRRAATGALDATYFATDVRTVKVLFFCPAKAYCFQLHP
jgi:hypothetical protein